MKLYSVDDIVEISGFSRSKVYQTISDNDRLKMCKTNFKFNLKPSYCVAYVTGCVF